jgi:hypothetical protein
VREDVRKSRHDSRKEIEGQVLRRAEVILDVVAENPEEKQVADDVKPPAMEKDREQCGEEKRDGVACRDRQIGSWNRRRTVVRELARDGGVFDEVKLSPRGLPETGFEEEERVDVRRDKAKRNNREAARRVGVRDRYQAQHPLSIGLTRKIGPVQIGVPSQEEPNAGPRVNRSGEEASEGAR